MVEFAGPSAVSQGARAPGTTPGSGRLPDASDPRRASLGRSESSWEAVSVHVSVKHRASVRAIAAASLAVVVGAALSGCNLISEQRTTTAYAASDGVNRTVGGLEVRNALLIADADDNSQAALASLVLAAINTTASPIAVTASVEGSGSANLDLLADPASRLTPVGYNDGPELTFEGEFTAGSLRTVTLRVSYVDVEGARQTVEDSFPVPVLGGDEHLLQEYRTLVPEPEPTLTPLPGESVAPAPTSTGE